MAKIVDWLDRRFSAWERRTREKETLKRESQLEKYNHDHPPQQRLF